MTDSAAGSGSRSPRASVPEPAPFSPQYRALTGALIALITIVAFQEMAISTVMPTIARDLQAAGGYALAFSVMFTAQLLAIVLARVWIEAHGPLRVMRAGQLLIGLGGLLAGVAPNLEIFLAGRVCTGLGGGLVVVALYVTVGAVYPQRLRPRVFAWIASAWVLPSIVGPLVAAGLDALWSWRLVFLLVVPAVAATLSALSRVAHLRAAREPTAPPEAARHPTVSGRRTASAAVLVAAGAGVFQWAGTRLVPPRPESVALALLGLAMLAVTLPRILPPGALVLRRGLPSVVLARGLFTAAFNGAVTFVPLYLVAQRGLSQALAGLILALASIGWTVGAWLQGRDRLAHAGPALVAVGAACVVGGLSMFVLLALTGAPALLAVPAGALLGVGMGLGTTVQSVLTLTLAPREDHASASSALTLSDTLGSAVGISITGALYASLADRAGAAVFSSVWTAAAAIALVAVLAGLRSSPPPVAAGSGRGRASR